MPRNPIAKVTDDQLQKDLEKYRRRAIEMGATDAKILPANVVTIDERVTAKCRYPRCPQYGTNANCPPYAMPPGELRAAVKNFRYAVLVKMDVPAQEITSTGAREKNLSAISRRKVTEIVARLESEAFRDGYYLALALGGATCKSLFCPEVECQALLPGKSCREKHKARSSMEGVGIDCYDVATKAGWPIYPIGLQTQPDEVPYGLRLGIVFVA